MRTASFIRRSVRGEPQRRNRLCVLARAHQNAGAQPVAQPDGGNGNPVARQIAISVEANSAMHSSSSQTG